MKLNSHNEWDALKTVVVGTISGFSPGLEMVDASPDILENAISLARKAYPQWYLDEVGEDLEGLCNIFRQSGVDVLRPN